MGLSHIRPPWAVSESNSGNAAAPAELPCVHRDVGIRGMPRREIARDTYIYSYLAVYIIRTLVCHV